MRITEPPQEQGPDCGKYVVTRSSIDVVSNPLSRFAPFSEVVSAAFEGFGEGFILACFCLVVGGLVFMVKPATEEFVVGEKLVKDDLEIRPFLNKAEIAFLTLDGGISRAFSMISYNSSSLPHLMDLDFRKPSIFFSSSI